MAANSLAISGNGKVFRDLAEHRRQLGGGGNSVTIGSATPGSSPASSSNPSYEFYGKVVQLNVGLASLKNTLTVNNGAYVTMGSPGRNRHLVHWYWQHFEQQCDGHFRRHRGSYRVSQHLAGRRLYQQQWQQPSIGANGSL